MRQLADEVAGARLRAAQLAARIGQDGVREVLCEPARLAIVGMLEGAELSVGELAAAIGRKMPATSQHLRVLRQLGLVTRRRRGRAVAYRLATGAAAERVSTVLAALTPPTRLAG
jgi:DNA-binding transcriptional ArsR family regulator